MLSTASVKSGLIPEKNPFGHLELFINGNVHVGLKVNVPRPI